MYQFDVKSTFLNGDLEEEVYISQPQGFVINGNENKVHKLRKAHHGLKQAPRAWCSKIDLFFHDCGLTKSDDEPTLYLKKQGNEEFLVACLYIMI